MDRPGRRPPAADEHWAPDHIVLDRTVLSYAGRLLLEREADGEVLVHSPLDGMAAVEQRYPTWALGPFGRIEPERELSPGPGVYALVTGGTVRYVGSSTDLARTFSPRGLGAISRRDCQNPRAEERCRLNRLITSGARSGTTVDLYVAVLEAPGRLARLVGRPTGQTPEQVAERLAAVAKGSWHLPR